MTLRNGIKEEVTALLELSDLKLVSCEVLQTLWAGYGHICSLKASPANGASKRVIPLILKYVSPPARPGRIQDEGHLRKVISYQVEQYFYTHLASLMPANIAIARCVASFGGRDSTTTNNTAMILSDLRESFPVAGEKRGLLDKVQVHAAIDWLARFHGFWWQRNGVHHRKSLRAPPLEDSNQPVNGEASRAGVWLNGGYTYLATRRKEYADLLADIDSEWATKLCSPFEAGDESIAERVARLLSPQREGRSATSAYETLIHGDVKSENLFTTADGSAVAFYDFQYVGLGLGVCDLTKLFTCSVPVDALTTNVDDGVMGAGEEALLRTYADEIQTMSGKIYEWEVLKRHWETALVDWLRFQASWGFWGNTDWLEARVRAILADEKWRLWLDDSLSSFPS